MKDQKLGEFKIIARATKDRILIAYKRKADLNTITRYGFTGIIGEGFTFYLGKDFTQVIYEHDDKGRKYLELVQPAKDEKVKVYLVDKETYHRFLTTDYNGKEL